MLWLSALYKPLGLVEALRGLIAAHPFTALVVVMVVVFAIFNAAVQALEKPTATSGPGYRFLFRFAHGLAFNFRYALRAKFPQYVPESTPSEPSNASPQ